MNDSLKLIGLNYYDFITDIDEEDPSYTTDFADEEKRTKAELRFTMRDGEEKSFTPKQFNFHVPPEHTVDGDYYDVEVHFVHVIKDSGRVDRDGVRQNEEYGTIIGIFFQVKDGEDSPFIESLFDAYDSQGNSEERGFVALEDFLSGVDMSQFWSYDGSFTNPPCTEGINWIVIKQVQPISRSQLDRFKARLEGS